MTHGDPLTNEDGTLNSLNFSRKVRSIRRIKVTHEQDTKQQYM